MDAEFAEICCNFSEILVENIHTSFAATPQPLKVMATVCGECMVGRRHTFCTVR